MPERMRALEVWLSSSVGLEAFDLAPASADASFRRYFRVTLPGGQNYVAMDAPPEQEDCRPYVAMARQLEALGVHVPKIHAENLEQGFLLLEDFGSLHYLDALDEASMGRLYGDALDSLAIIQARGPREGLPSYDEPMLRREMALFPEWLLEKQLAIVLDTGEQALLDAAFDLLVDNALEQPQVCVHRDYHSRNLLVTAERNPGVLDFQDAVVGPVTYDLASLLRDCYISWPRERVEAWAMDCFALAVQSGVLRQEHEARFIRWFDLMGMQRHLKASGIFARLNQRDGKPGYLKDIPRTLGYVVEVAGRYPELNCFGELLAQRVIPRVEAFAG
ncbi:aminoglycoside phosphotransferase family protein [Solemya velesiana gill symbiont]|uniref:Aminoglycoside phosphotransferase n=1 Tax=Solemya velesiana gill symbiont TaxID=1918948 RepID=A0A1T2KYA9_9GAMM|nr:phosphotransferase [Solemya velesiana gill symbiont]OOZ37813.1 aminoglycoside phosphotransferase [Solemya velesiana gill symbiont]